MHVVHLINGLGPGGAERSLVELLPYYRENGIASTVVHLKDRSVGFEAEARGIDCTIHRLSGDSLSQWIPAFRRYVKQVRPDLVHTSLLEAHLVGRLGAAGTGVPVVSSLVNTTYEGPRVQDPNLSTWKFRLVRLADMFTARLLTAHFHAITHTVQASYEKTLGLDPARITVVGRGRSRERLGERTPERRAQVRHTLGIEDDRVVLLNVGRQDYQKGQIFAVEAMPALLERRPNVLLVIAGRPGTQTPDLQEAVRRLQLEEHVRFLGHRDDVTDVMAAADLFVFPSLFEGLGGAVIEAMGLGLPVVASDIPVLREVLGEAGTFARPGDPDALADQLDQLLRNPARANRLSNVGAERFEQRFEIRQTAAEMVAMYRQVASAGVPARHQVVDP